MTHSRSGRAPEARSPASEPDEGASADATWIELSVVADPEAVEAVSDILSRHAGGGTSIEPAFELVDEGLSARVLLDRPAVVRAYVPGADARAARVAVDGARRDLGHLQAFDLRPIGELTTRVVHESDWAAAWKAHFPVLRVGRHVVIRPTWRRHRRAPEDVVLALDPGMAFGTGLHPTTRLCLAALERLAAEGRVAAARVLDVGSGSGILSVCAARFGAAEVLALDPDPIAVEATIANARRNRVRRPVHARRGSVPSGEPPFDVVLANLIASLLVDLAEPLAGELAQGGVLVASGIFVDREPEVRTAFGVAGLRVTRTASEGDWVVVEAERAEGGTKGSLEAAH
ncbi:MAG TPA: 50S ribosomal protein L11 methyltransferase [Candidatus Limnocylindrales bacterium]|nr:50S ribosomal protein L11 methyltransferase [Candidatus Limnocylindrales bacterium]